MPGGVERKDEIQKYYYENYTDGAVRFSDRSMKRLLKKGLFPPEMRAGEGRYKKAFEVYETT